MQVQGLGRKPSSWTSHPPTTWQAMTSSSSPHLPRGPVAEFFAYHGVWAPGIRLFRGLTFRKKIAWIASVFLLPIGVMLWTIWSSAALSLDTVRLELKGFRAMRLAIPSLMALTEVRNSTRAGLGGLDTASDLRGASQRLTGHLAALQDLVQADGDTLGVLKDLEELKAAWTTASAVAGGVDSEGRTVYGPVVERLNGLVGKIRDRSSLSLDPEADAYRLIDAIYFQGPDAIENLGQVWGWRSYSEGRGLNTKQINQLVGWAALATGALGRMDESLKAAVAANPKAGGKIPPEVLPPLQAWAAAVQDLDSLEYEGAPKTYAKGKERLASFGPLYEQAEPALEALLLAREEALVRSRNLDVGLTAACLVLAAYLFASFGQVLAGGQAETVRHLRAMTGGDLTTKLNPRGNDEMAELMLELSAMQAALRDMVLQVRHSSDQIETSTIGIANGASELSARTEHSAASLEQTAAAMEEIAATVGNATAHSLSAAELAKGSAGQASAGSAVMKDMVAVMRRIDQSSARIGAVNAVIDSIATQTNILALNAAVEAARAGDAGRSFAVVAAEIRALAKRSTDAAKEIRTLVIQSQEDVAAGAATAGKADLSIGAVEQACQSVSTSLAQVAVCAREQQTGISQVGSAIQELDKVTQANAALVEQTSAAAISVRDQAGVLSRAVARFNIEA